jgi:hypothetical protein
VPIGGFSITVADTSALLSGSVSGTVPSAGATVVANIQLTANLVVLPRSLGDANLSYYSVGRQGKLVSGLFTGSFSNTALQGSFGLQLVQGTVVADFSETTPGVATTELEGRQIVFQRSMLGLRVTRKVFVPDLGYFARYLELLENPGTEPVTLDLSLVSHLFSPAGRFITTSSGGAARGWAGSASSPTRWTVKGSAGGGVTPPRPPTTACATARFWWWITCGIAGARRWR